MAPLQQYYDFYVSIIETDLSTSQDFTTDEQDPSVGESFIADESEIHDLLEIGRFSMDSSNTNLKPLRRREVRSEDDLQDVLGLINRQRASISPNDQSDGMTFVMTLCGCERNVMNRTIEGGEMKSDRRICGQIHFCDVSFPYGMKFDGRRSGERGVISKLRILCRISCGD